MTMADEPIADVVARVLRRDAGAPGQCWYVDATEPAFLRVREDDGLPGGALVADLVTQANALLIAEFRTDAVTLAREVERLTKARQSTYDDLLRAQTEVARLRDGIEALADLMDGSPHPSPTTARDVVVGKLRALLAPTTETSND